MNGITFNGKHSFTDFNLIMNSKKISTPSKKKIKVSVPFMNSTYDFSTIGSNGEITYNQRSIEIQFTLMSTSKAMLQSKLTKIAEWLQDVAQSQLIFDDIKDYYFMAELEDTLDLAEAFEVGEFTVKFIAEPFKTSTDYVGNDIWDTFNFEEDIVQNSSFNVVSTSTVSIYNSGRLITPTIICNAPMTVIIGGVTYNLITGDNKIYGLKLQNGYNAIIINGTGTISFLFKKVVI